MSLKFVITAPLLQGCTQDVRAAHVSRCLTHDSRADAVEMSSVKSDSIDRTVSFVFVSAATPNNARLLPLSLSLSYSLSPSPVMLSVAFKESFMPAGLLGAKAFGKHTTAPKGAAGYFAKATSAECVCTCSARVCMCLKSYRELLRRALEGYSGKVLGKKHFLRKFVTFSFILC